MCHKFVKLHLVSYQNNHYSQVQFPLSTFMNQKSQTELNIIQLQTSPHRIS